LGNYSAQKLIKKKKAKEVTSERLLLREIFAKERSADHRRRNYASEGNVICQSKEIKKGDAKRNNVKETYHQPKTSCGKKTLEKGGRNRGLGKILNSSRVTDLH